MDSKTETPQALGLQDVMRTIALEPDMAKVRLSPTTISAAGRRSRRSMRRPR